MWDLTPILNPTTTLTLNYFGIFKQCKNHTAVKQWITTIWEDISNILFKRKNKSQRIHKTCPLHTVKNN